MDSAAAVRRWIDAWERGWRAHDADVVASVYAAAAAFRSHPFRAPHAPRDYALWAFETEEALIEVRWGRPFIAADRAVVEYWAVIREANGESTIAGVALLRF